MLISSETEEAMVEHSEIPPIPQNRRKKSLFPTNLTDFREWLLKKMDILPPHLRDRFYGLIMEAVTLMVNSISREFQEQKDQVLRALVKTHISRIRKLELDYSGKIEQLKQKHEELIAQLNEKSGIDPKTELYNFKRFFEKFEDLLKSTPENFLIVVGVIDLSGFKGVNDNFGHHVGDLVLHRFGELMKSEIRSDDLVTRERRTVPRNYIPGRYGGDEFFWVAVVENRKDAYRLVQRLFRKINSGNWVSDIEVLRGANVGGDMGVICFPNLSVNNFQMWTRIAKIARAAVRAADISMYVAKGRSRRMKEKSCIKNEIFPHLYSCDAELGGETLTVYDRTKVNGTIFEIPFDDPHRMMNAVPWMDQYVKDTETSRPKR